MAAPTIPGTGTAPSAPLALPPNSPDLYLKARDGGFVAHLVASADTLAAVRKLTLTALTAYGADEDTAATAQLLLSELVGNAERAAGPHAPVLVEIYRDGGDVIVAVHDPVPQLLPRRSAAPHSALAESGRGLPLLDALAPGWTVKPSPIGKQIRCTIPAS
jgi:anti-sigma regulatory factor (Ser/Thr protein kinase)